jgi:predicted TIM-barrel fold metal-dependent hydrolase
MNVSGQNTSASFGGHKVIDVDTHLSEPHDLWTSRAPASIRDRVPQVKMHEGQLCWVIDGDKSIGDGAQANASIRKDGVKCHNLGFTAWRLEDVHPGSWEVKARLAYMDENGISAQVVYPNLLGFGGQKAAVIEPDLRLQCAQIFNDAMAEFQEQSNNRLFPMALLPWWDAKLAAQEAERCSAMGLRGININSDPHLKVGLDGRTLPDLSSDYWTPLWEVCVDRKLPVNFHIGGTEQVWDMFRQQGWPSLSKDTHAAVGGAMLNMDNARVMANIIFSGLLDRQPKLKFVSVESGVGWIPFMLETYDHHYLEIADAKGLQRLPSEYFRTNFYACFWYERKNLSAMLRAVGLDNVMFETDFPHPTCLYPIDDVAGAMADLTSAERDKVLSGNAAKVYNIPLN